jgi:hypothetical protein
MRLAPVERSTQSLSESAAALDEESSNPGDIDARANPDDAAAEITSEIEPTQEIAIPQEQLVDATSKIEPAPAR